ncbi:hypothetical protein DF268_08095 [Streptomyces sp. V2]|nr:hypothetical protein DF268_08095 [Streptomyces sp. V2]
MTAHDEDPLWRERSDSQWADYGVNVGHAVYGGIHFHPPASSDTWSGRRNTTTNRIRATWHVKVRSALTDLAGVCARTATALTHLGPDKAGKGEG